MKVFIVLVLCLSSSIVDAQKFYLGNYLEPTPNEFELLGASSKTGVHSYKYKKEIYDTFFERKIGDIIVGIRDGIIVTTIYNLIPQLTDKGVPSDILKLLGIHPAKCIFPGQILSPFFVINYKI